MVILYEIMYIEISSLYVYFNRYVLAVFLHFLLHTSRILIHSLTCFRRVCPILSLGPV